jgi:hypothetical protein
MQRPWGSSLASKLKFRGLTADIPPVSPISQKIKEQASEFSLIHPQQEFQLKMTTLRKQYLREHQELLKRKAQAQADQKLQEFKARQARIQDIKSYKTEQEAEFSAYEDSVTAQKKAKKPKNKEPYHKVFQMTQAQLDEFYSKRTLARWSRFKRQVVSNQNKTTESLMYLYNETSEFVTYRNMDEKIDQVVTGTPESLGLSIQDMVNKTLRETHPRIQKELSERQQAVKDAVFGTLYGKTSLQTIDKLAKLPSKEWAKEAEKLLIEQVEPEKPEYTKRGLLNRLKNPSSDGPRKMA